MARTKPGAPPVAADIPNTPAKPSGGVGVSDTDVKRFAALFQGWSKAYGVCDMSQAKKDDKGKMVGKSWTEKGAPPLSVYARHLQGKNPGLGIIMLRDDDTCLFGVIDYDVRGMDHLKAEQAVKRLKLPLILCKSKSTGGHFYVFLQEPVEAADLRDKLDEWRALLGMSPRTETFPKQSARFNDTDIGSWINLPYFGGDATERCAVIDGKDVDLKTFLRAAEAAAISPEQLLSKGVSDDDQLFKDGPPCLQVIHGQGGFPDGTRNDGMMAVAVYLKKRFGDAWVSHMDEYNQEMAGLPSTEVVDLVKKNTKKDYTYACKRSPINSVCQRRTCTKREFGIGDAPVEGKGHAINAIIRYDSQHGDEPMWGMEINGKRVLVSNSQFYSRDEFNRAVMAQANVVPIHLTPAKWLRYLSEVIGSADIVQMPDDASPTGQLWQWVDSFTLQTVNAMDKEEVWLGKPYRDGSKVYFRSQDLFRYLDARKVRYVSAQAVWQLLRHHGADQEKWHIKGRFVNVWSLPIAADWTEEDTPTPQLPRGGMDEF